MSLFKEFKQFAMRGNIVDLAVGVVIGGAFQSIVTSLVNDIIMPFTSVFTGRANYKDWVIDIFGGAAKIQIGSFITAIINFLIVAFTIFLVLKYINKLNKKIDDLNKEVTETLNKNPIMKFTKKIEKKDVEEKKEDPKTKICPYCLSEIPYKATKCCYCTSDLTEENEDIKVTN